MQNECHVSLNTLDNRDGFLTDVRTGRWDHVLPQIANLKLSKAKLDDLYEHIVLELVELRETDTARAMLRQTEVFARMQQDDPDRYIGLERLCNRTFVDSKDLYKGTSRDKRRSAISQALSTEIAAAPPSRLMVLLGQALKWQQHQGLLPLGAPVDLFHGTFGPAEAVEEETFASGLSTTVRFGSKSHAECAIFSPDGRSLVTGSIDGFIEVWDYSTGKLRKDLVYQAEDKFMMHDTAVLCLAFSRDKELLASGSQDGIIKVWRFASGQCIRRFESAHTQGVTSVSFSDDGSHVLSSSYDGLVRVHGIKSGRMLKEFRGHTSYVNSALYITDGTSIVSASSDSTLRFWDVKSCECTAVITPPQPTLSGEVAVHSVILDPANPEQLIVCTHSPTIYVMTTQGQVVKSFATKKTVGDGTDYLACACSSLGTFVYGLAEDGTMHCFAARSGSLVNSIKTTEKGAIGIVHHPYRNLVATFSQEGVLKIWKA